MKLNPEDLLDTNLVICKFCKMRLLTDRKSFDFSLVMSKMKDYFQNDIIQKKCNLCISLLSFSATIDCLVNDVIIEIEKCNYEFIGFQLNITEPFDFPIRDQLAWAILSESGVEIEKINAWKDSHIQLKSLLKYLIKENICEHFSNVHFIANNESIKFMPELTEKIPPGFDPLNFIIAIDLEISYDSKISELICLSLVNSIASFKNCDPKNYQVKRNRMGKKKFKKYQNQNFSSQEIKSEVKFSRGKIEEILKDLPSSNLIAATKQIVDDSYRFDDKLQPTSKICISRVKPLIVAGRYVKLSRKLSQSPWFIESEWKTETSVEELLSIPICLAASGQIKNENKALVTSVFVSSGREDIDVRCLGYGRPFLVELSNYPLLPTTISRIYSTFPDLNNLDILASEINKKSNKLILARDLQFTTGNLAAEMIKNQSDDLAKKKCYRALCWCSNGGINDTILSRLIKKLGISIDQKPIWDKDDPNCSFEIKDLDINQLTPIRVLHRRTLSNRMRRIFSLVLFPFCKVLHEQNFKLELKDFIHWNEKFKSEELFVIEIQCASGTYIKEFVHGDLGRCEPSLASLFEETVDLLDLDVTAIQLDFPPILPSPNIAVALS